MQIRFISKKRYVDTSDAVSGDLEAITVLLEEVPVKGQYINLTFNNQMYELKVEKAVITPNASTHYAIVHLEPHDNRKEMLKKLI